MSLRQWFADIIKCVTKSLENEEIASLPNVLKARKILKLNFACENNISSSIVRKPKCSLFQIIVTMNWNPFPLFPVWICGEMSYGLHAKTVQENRFESLFQRQNEVILLRKTFENALIIHVQQNHFKIVFLLFFHSRKTPTWRMILRVMFGCEWKVW